MTGALVDFFVEESGQGLVEYAFILMLVALAAVTGLTLLGKSVMGAYQEAANSF